MFTCYRTSKRKGERFARINPPEFNTRYNADSDTVAVDTSMLFQTHLGFGGAFTESAAHTLMLAGKSKRDEVIKAYFSESGINYNLGRVAVHSCDFSLKNYTYIEEGDKELKTFDMSHEDKWVVPLILDSIKARGSDLTLFSSSWSPPAFMKTNNDINYGGRLKSEYRKPWAEYLAKFTLGLKQRGINVFAMSVQNEPEAIQVWESRYVSALEEGEFIADFLAPAFIEAGLDPRFIIWDHNRDRVVKRANTTLQNVKAAQYIWGTGYHWYVSNESKNLSALRALHPDKHILLTECCVELTNTAINSESGAVYMGSWKNGETYGRNIINDFNNFSEGWIDWNLVLDEQGGPNHVGNYCEAPIMYDTKTDKLVYNNSYYYIGHFSKFIKEGARRVLCSNDVEEGLYSIAYVNPDGEIVVVIQNEGWIKELALVIDGKGVNVSLPDSSISTFVYKK